MFKKFLLILCFACIPAFAGVYESAVSGDKDVILYLYTQDCMMCQRFNARYEQMKKAYPDLKFVSVDAETPYGSRLMWKFRARYVPYLILTGHKTGKSAVINPSCSMDELCMNRALKGFKG